jgi:GT2 family glycosyltransferase
MSSASTVGFVTISYNRREQLRSLLTSVYAGRLVPNEIVVVDNASQDGTIEMLARDFPGVRVIANSENRLASYAANQGLRVTTSDYVYLTADDNVVDVGCIAELRKAMDAIPDAGIVTPVMYYYDASERVWFAGVTLDMLTGITRFATELPGGAYAETSCAPNCFMIRRTLLERIGGLDLDAFPFHHEEADFSFRAAKSGFKTYVVRDAREWHRTPVPKRRPVIGSGDYSIDDPRRAYFHARSRALLARRHAAWPVRAIFFTLFFPLTVVAYSTICFVHSRQRAKTSLAFVRGAVDGITMRLPDPPPPMFA